MRVVLAALACALAAACASGNPYYDKTKQHHRPDGFVNNDTTQKLPELNLAQQLYRNFTGYFRPLRPPLGGYEAFAAKWSAKPQLEWIRANRKTTAITWLGHATTLLQVNGLNILTDPNFSDRASPVAWAGPRRLVPSPVQVSDLPTIDWVVISHNHYDHFDRPTVLALAAAHPKLVFVVPIGMKPWFDNEGIASVREIDWWDRVDAGAGVDIHLVPVQHWSKRTAWDRNQALWGGYVIEARAGAKPWRYYFSGDTGYSADFAEVRKRLGDIDLAALAVGAYEPRDFMRVQHLNPEDAVRAMLDLGAHAALGIHWGTFELTQEPFDQPPEDLAAARTKLGVAPERFFLMKHGETRRIDRRE